MSAQTLNQKRNYKQLGFTLIELMISISIIAIISSVGFISYQKAQSLGRDAKRKQDLRSIAIALELYYQKNKQYPITTGWVSSAGGSNTWIPGLDTNYINSLPKDPNNSATNCNGSGTFPASCNTYSYFAGDWCISGGNNGRYYILATRLENGADKDIKTVNFGPGTPCPWSSPSVFVISN